jgi:hypothetical protein
MSLVLPHDARRQAARLYGYDPEVKTFRAFPIAVTVSARGSRRDRLCVRVASDFQVRRPREVMMRLGENVAGLIHGFESRWSHQSVFVDV